MYSLMTGSGFDGGAYSSAWIGAWAVVGVFGILCFLLFKLKQNDQIPFPYSVPGSLVGPLGAVIAITFFGSPKIGFLVGLIGLLGGAYFMGRREEGG